CADFTATGGLGLATYSGPSCAAVTFEIVRERSESWTYGIDPLSSFACNRHVWNDPTRADAVQGAQRTHKIRLDVLDAHELAIDPPVDRAKRDMGGHKRRRNDQE